MPKRENRLKPIAHERRQIENLKALEPVSTPADLKHLSDALIDIASCALDAVYDIEDEGMFEAGQLERLYFLINRLPDTVINPAHSA